MTKGVSESAGTVRNAPRSRLGAAVRWIRRFLVDALVPPLGLRQTAILCRELYMTYKAGIPLGRGLEIISGHAASIRVRRLARRMCEDIRRGATLGDTFHWHRKRFPEFTSECMKSGDVSGKLEEAFRHLSEYYDDLVKLRGEILNALGYPLAVLGAIYIFMGPFFGRMLEYGLGQGFDAEAFLREVGWNALRLAAMAAVLWYVSSVLRQVGAWRVLWGVVGTHVWPFAPIARRFALARFFRGLAMLLEGGIGAPRSIEGSARRCGNVAVGYDLARAAPLVRDGMPMAAALGRSRYLPPVEAGMLEVGEHSGMLDATLRKVSQYCIQDGLYTIRRWVASLEVIAIILIGLRGLPFLVAGLF